MSILRREVRLIPISALARRSDFFGLLAYASATVVKDCIVTLHSIAPTVGYILVNYTFLILFVTLYVFMYNFLFLLFVY